MAQSSQRWSGNRQGNASARRYARPMTNPQNRAPCADGASPTSARGGTYPRLKVGA